MNQAKHGTNVDYVHILYNACSLAIKISVGLYQLGNAWAANNEKEEEVLVMLQ